MQFESINGLSVCQFGEARAPVVLLLHGHSQTGLMWMDTASLLAEHGYRALALHLPGIGESAPSPEGHRKTSVAAHIRTCLKSTLGENQPLFVVGHDLGAMVAYAFAAQFPDEVAGLVMLETPIAGLPPWDEILHMPQTWHFGLTGEHCEALVKGREDIYLARFWQEMSSRPGAISRESREAYVKTYSLDGVMRNSFDYFATFPFDAQDNIRLSKQKLNCPVMACGGAMGMGSMVGNQAQLYASNVLNVVIDSAAHYLVEENPDETHRALLNFLKI